MGQLDHIGNALSFKYGWLIGIIVSVCVLAAVVAGTTWSGSS